MNRRAMTAAMVGTLLAATPVSPHRLARNAQKKRKRSKLERKKQKRRAIARASRRRNR